MSIDVRTSPRRRRHPRISYVLGSSTEPHVVATVRRRASRASSVLVILDSDHRAEHVLQELRHYAPLVTPGSYVIVEDTNVNGHPIEPGYGPGPKEAIDLFLREDPSFTVDHGREKFYLSFNPSGFLRKMGPASEGALAPNASRYPGPSGSPMSADLRSLLHAPTMIAALRHHLRARLRARALAVRDRRGSSAVPKPR